MAVLEDEGVGKQEPSLRVWMQNVASLFPHAEPADNNNKNFRSLLSEQIEQTLTF